MQSGTSSSAESATRFSQQSSYSEGRRSFYAPCESTAPHRIAQKSGRCHLTGLLLAVVWANSPFAATYEAIHDAPASVSIGAFTIAKPMISWINEGLMVFFFFLVGLELKRETFEGGLSSPALMALPAAAAIGGMVVPVAIYLLITAGDPGSSQGWAIPAATDIVLALSLLALLGERAPRALVVFLTALAVFDDLGALIIIAGFYTDSLSATALLAAALGICGLIGLNRLGVARIAPYLLTGVLVWVAVLKSGVHATLAGVVIAWCIPLKVGARPVLKRIEHDLRPWVSLLVIPVFAFFNAGITFSGISVEALLQPASLGVIAGLFVGKQLGVFGAARLAVALRLARLPEGTTWSQIYGVAILGGVGFTMSLFIAALAYQQPGMILKSNVSIVVGSALSACVGMIVLARSCRSPMTPQTERS
ncbi:MAG: Na+/H+ antiporter NhaA [Pseudomonadales bacterium]